MRLTEKPERLRSLLRLVIPGVVLVYASSAHAADVTLGIIGPHEYDLPVDLALLHNSVYWRDEAAIEFSITRPRV